MHVLLSLSNIESVIYNVQIALLQRAPKYILPKYECNEYFIFGSLRLLVHSRFDKRSPNSLDYVI